jgi:phosphomannomutase
MIGIALFLSLLANEKLKLTELRAKYPQYFISKNKIELSPSMDVDKILEEVKLKFAHERVTDIDGIKVDFDAEKKWVHLRKSNTEPIIRIYAEASSEELASSLAMSVIKVINEIIST